MSRRFVWPRLGLVPSLLLLAALMAEGALKGFVNSEPGPLRGWTIALYMCGWTSAWLCYPVAKLAVASAPDASGRWTRFVAHHLAGYALCACICLMGSRALRAALTYALGITLPAPSWLDDYLAGVHLHTTFHAGLVFALSAGAIADERARIAIDEAELDAMLAVQRLETAASRVDPDELVVALRSVKRSLREDVREAERLTQRLGDSLRRALTSGEGSGRNVKQEPPIQAPTPSPRSAPRAFRLPEVSARGAAVLLAMVVLVGAVHGVTFALGIAPFQFDTFAVFPVSAVAAWFLQPLVQLIALNMPDRQRTPARFALHHLLGFCVFLVAATVVGGLAQSAGARILGFTLPPPGAARLDWTLLLGSLDISSLWYVLLVAGWSAHYAARDRNDVAIRKARLESAVARGRLAALGARLEPHFLFNALNTVTAVMYQDIERTERMLDDLEKLMSESFRREPIWSLREERDHTLRFADFVHVRFGNRIRIVWPDVPELGPVRLPRFAVQTLVENSIKHNAARRGPLLIEVDTAAEDGRLRLSVNDDGGGLSPSPELGGRSLSRLDEMLGLLHPGSGRVVTATSPLGGARVDLVIPQDTAGATA